MDTKSQKPKLAKGLRDALHNLRSATRAFETRMREAQAEPNGSNTRGNRLLDAESQACAILAYGRMVYRTVERALPEESGIAAATPIPKPIALPGLESETIRGAVKDLAEIIRAIDEGWPRSAKEDAERLQARLCSVFQIPK